MNAILKNLTIERKNLLIIFISRFLLFLSSYGSVSILLNILDKNVYGVWLTLVGTLNWILFFDFGIGNSLKNHITVFLVENDLRKIKQLISQTYFSSIIIALVIFFIGLCLIFSFNLTIVFNTTILQSELNLSIFILLVSFCLQIIIKNIVPILHSFQRVGTAEILGALSSILFIILLLTAVPKNISLPLLAIIYGITHLFIFSIFSLLFFKKSPHFSPKVKFGEMTFDKKMLNLGLDFFVIQMAGMILYSTDSYLISYLISPSEVPQYHVVMKYFNIIILGFGMFLAPVWPMVSKKYAEKDFLWIRDKVENLLKIFGMFIVLGIGMLIFAEFVYKIWIGDKLHIPFNLSLTLFFYSIILIWGNLFAVVMNGIGKAKFQMLLSIFSIVMNIPLSILFVKVFNWGVIGIPLATCISMLLNGGLIAMQYYLVINLKATGIFNR